MFAFGINVRLLEVAATPRLPGAVSTSPTVKASAAVAVPLSVVWLAIAAMVGTSFTAVTVRTKVSLVVVVPSFTVTVIVAVPNSFSAGVAVSVREAPVPPKTRFALGMSVVFEEVAVTVRAAAAVSTSPIVKARAAVAVSSAVVVATRPASVARRSPR
jgi:hypothetical protein